MCLLATQGKPSVNGCLRMLKPERSAADIQQKPFLAYAGEKTEEY